MNKEEYKKELLDLISDEELTVTDNIEQSIYIIDDIKIDGWEGYYEPNSPRGLDHKSLISLIDNTSWEEVLNFGTVVVPETKSYISDTNNIELSNLGYSRLSLNNNHIVGFREENFSNKEQNFFSLENVKQLDKELSIKGKEQNINRSNDKER